MNKSEKEYIVVLEKQGIKILGERRTKHRILKCKGPYGNNFNLTLPTSPSDVKGIKNFKTTAKRHIMKGLTNETHIVMG